MRPRNNVLMATILSLLLVVAFATGSMAACGKKNLLRQAFGGDICRAANKTVDTAVKVVNEVGEELEKVVCGAGKIVDSDAECNVSVGVAVNRDGEVGLTNNDGTPPEKTVSLVSKSDNDVVMAFPNLSALGITVIQIDGFDGNHTHTSLPHGLVCQSSNLCGYPKAYNYSEGRDPAYIESPIEMTSLAMGIDELRRIKEEDPWWHYVVVGGGVAADLVAMAVPGLPGGAGIVAKAYRKTYRASSVDKEINLLVRATFIPRKTIEKIPDDWVLRHPRKGLGIRFQPPRSDGGTHIRFKTDADPLDPTTWTVRAQREGKALNSRGEVLESARSPEAHFSVKDFNDHFPLDAISHDAVK